MRSLAAFALAFAALFWAGSAMAEAPRLFTVAGGSSTGPLKFGRPATTVSVDPDTVLGLPDGGFAFFDVESNRVLRVDRVGRVHVLAGNGRNGASGDGGPATRARLWWADDLALHPDGILLADDIAGTVRLVRHDGVMVRLARAPSARGVAVAANGDILIAGEDRVRRLSPDGTLSGFAGTGESGSGGDGGPAAQAQLNPASSVAIAADGSVYIATYGALRRVSPDGIISTVARPFWLERLAMTPAGLVAATGDGETDEIVVRVAPDGTVERIAGGRRDSAFDGDGESPLGLRFGASDVAPAADGGLLIAAFDSIRYLPPEHPQRLAVAITRPTLTSPRRLRVSLALTMPAAVTLRVAGRGVKVAPIRAALGAGDATLRLRRRLPAGTYIVRVTARGADGQLATDRQPVFPGGVLSIRAARVVAAERVRRAQAILRPSPPGHVGKCRRFGRKRVDCKIIMRGYGCWEVASVRLRVGTGLPYVRAYDNVLDGVCRFRRFAHASAPPPADALFTLAGNGALGPLAEGGPATAAGLRPGARLAVQPDGGLLITDRGRVRRVDPSGRIATVAGTGRPGSSGDGGPATRARVRPSDVAVTPDGGFAIAECNFSRKDAIRRVSADGTITTVARLFCPESLIATADGALVVAQANRLVRIRADGSRTTIAGNGEAPDPGQRGGPALQTPLAPSDVAALSDGSLLIADDWAFRVYRLADGRLTPLAGSGAEGMRPDDGRPALAAAISPAAVAPVAGGGFYVVDVGRSSLAGSEPRLRLVQPDGTIVTVAGTGRFAANPTRPDGLRGDGMPPRRADLRDLHDVAVLPDGGVVFSEGPDPFDNPKAPGLVRYLPPQAGGRLAVAVRRDRDRLFRPGHPAFATVRLTAAATVSVTVRADGRAVSTQEHVMPAGETRVRIPALTNTNHVITAVARDAAGRVGRDRAALLPRGWLATSLARTTAGAVVYDATPWRVIYGDGIVRCRRLAANRVDCAAAPSRKRCRRVITVRLGHDGRLRWGAYRCPIARAPSFVHRPRALRRRHYTCDVDDSSCPPRVFGVVAPRWLVPWD